MTIAVATCSALPPQFDDDHRLIEALAGRGADAVHAVWDDPGVRWDDFERVIIRTTWDYPHKHAAFLAWADALGDRLENPARVVRWNSDKHHLLDLIAAGIPTVPTRFVEPGDDLPPLDGEVVVKPAISVGGRLTGRFGPATHGEARRLIARHHEEGRAAMVQRYLSSVDIMGETALVFLAGEFSHAAHKRAVLRPDEIAPMRADDIGGDSGAVSSQAVEPARGVVRLDRRRRCCRRQRVRPTCRGPFALSRPTDGRAEGEQLRVRHDDGGGALAERREGRDKGGSRRGADADLGVTAEVGHREPSAVELTEPNADLDAQQIGPEAGVRADEARLLIHARDRRGRS